MTWSEKAILKVLTLTYPACFDLLALAKVVFLFRVTKSFEVTDVYATSTARTLSTGARFSCKNQWCVHSPSTPSESYPSHSGFWGRSCKNVVTSTPSERKLSTAYWHSNHTFRFDPPSTLGHYTSNDKHWRGILLGCADHTIARQVPSRSRVS